MPISRGVQPVDKNFGELADVAWRQEEMKRPSWAHKSKKTGYFDDGKRHVDYVLVYKRAKHSNGKSDQDKATASERQHEHQVKREFFIKKLNEAGVDAEIDENIANVVAVKLHANWSALCNKAQALRMQMPTRTVDPVAKLDEERRVRREHSAWGHVWNMRCLNYDDDPPDDVHQVFWPFDNNRQERFLINDQEKFFTPIQRSEIVWEIMQECDNDPHDPRLRGIETLLEEGVFNSAYPLHDGDYDSVNSSRRRLRDSWLSFGAIFKPQPVQRIRNYFGENVAFYFAFMDFYTKALVFPAVIGLMAFLYGLISVETHMKPVMNEICNEHHEIGMYVLCPICRPPSCEPALMHEEGCKISQWQYRLDNEATLIVSILTVIWAAIFFKYWRRRQSRLSLQWHTYNMYEMPGAIRADYERKAQNNQKIDMITGENLPHVSLRKRVRWTIYSVLITFVLLLLAGACLAGLIAARMQLYVSFHNAGGELAKKNVEKSRWLVHLFMFLMVFMFEQVYHGVAERLTTMECPKTERLFQASLLWKIFLFAELVDFLPIAYAAFIKGRSVRTPMNLDAFTETCEFGGCMSEVVELVAVLLVARLVIGNLVELFVPYIRRAISRFQARRRTSAGPNVGWPQWMKDLQLHKLDMTGASRELMEMMIQLSFVVFFVPALTLAPLICLLNNIVEIRVDAYNYLATHRREAPLRQQHLGVWNRFMELILKVAVLVNAGLIAFTSDIIPRLYYKYRVSPNYSLVGYAAFSMSRIDVEDWPELGEVVEEERKKLEEHHEPGPEAWIANITECHYFDYRDPEPPYSKTQEYWHVICYRVVAFAIFAIGFYILIFLINTLISDVPSDVAKRATRHRYIITKELEQAAGTVHASARLSSAYNNLAYIDEQADPSSTANGQAETAIDGDSGSPQKNVTSVFISD